MASLDGKHPAEFDVALAHACSEDLGAPDQLRDVQQIDSETLSLSGLCDDQHAAGRRRQLAAKFGELAGELMAGLASVGRSEQDARDATVCELGGIAADARDESTAS